MFYKSEIVFFIPFAISFVGVMIFISLKKRRRSAKSIYKLIDDLEKKYIY